MIPSTPPLRMKTYARVLGCIAAALQLGSMTGFAADVDPEEGGPVRQPKQGDYVLALTPKAFQRTPDLEMTVNTELTAHGRLLRRPTPQAPLYYVAHATGYKPMGAPVAGERPPPAANIERALRKALAVNGYLPAPPGEPPTIAIVYFWGSHYRMDPEMEGLFPENARRHRLERAMLVGGRTHLERMNRVLAYGELPTDRTFEFEYLRDQSLDDLYYVVASAYHYAALAQNERRLVWRTTMTVAARGVSMHETMMPLIATAAPFFGRPTEQPELASRRISRWRVDLGQPELIESDVPLKAADPAPGGRR